LLIDGTHHSYGETRGRKSLIHRIEKLVHGEGFLVGDFVAWAGKL
jgi:hypothetical protein